VDLLEACRSETPIAGGDKISSSGEGGGMVFGPIYIDYWHKISENETWLRSKTRRSSTFEALVYLQNSKRSLL
jgi:hypothetical protein